MLNIKKLLSKLVQQQENMIKVVHNVSLNSSGSIAAGRACAIVNTFVTNSIPDGYKLLAVVLRGTTNANFFCWYLDWTSTTNRVDYRVTNNGSSAAAVSPTVNLICVKLGGYCVVFARLSALLRGGAGHAEYKEVTDKTDSWREHHNSVKCRKQDNRNRICVSYIHTTDRIFKNNTIIGISKNVGQHHDARSDGRHKYCSILQSNEFVMDWQLCSLLALCEITIPERGWAVC